MFRGERTGDPQLSLTFEVFPFLLIRTKRVRFFFCFLGSDSCLVRL